MNNKYLNELVKNQIILKENKKLSLSDMKRIIKYTDKSLFGSECCLWSGYITENKIKYINFYFNKKKLALHRLLYQNYKGNLEDNQYLIYKCNNKGICCNVNHFDIKKNTKIPMCKHIQKSNKIIYFD